MFHPRTLPFSKLEQVNLLKINERTLILIASARTFPSFCVIIIYLLIEILFLLFFVVITLSLLDIGVKVLAKSINSCVPLGRVEILRLGSEPLLATFDVFLPLLSAPTQQLGILILQLTILYL